MTQPTTPADQPFVADFAPADDNHPTPDDTSGDPGGDPADAGDAVRRTAGSGESSLASRHWWDRNADSYQGEHGAFLGDDRFIWGPEGLDEADAHLLGTPDALDGRQVLEIGAGAAQCSRWLTGHGARPVALDISFRQLQHSRRIDHAHPGHRPVPVVQADAAALPFAAASFDLACSAYGAVPFSADTAHLMREVHRVLRPGGRWVFSVSHPIRWAFPDEPGPEGLTALTSYFDRRPYVEEDAEGRAVYVEHHRTLGDRVRELVAAGFRLEDLVEPPWPDHLEQQWGGWSPLRGRLLPGTAIFVSVRD
jgi:Methylase involved in ubiquinone/menaquinone biosynthesis